MKVTVIMWKVWVIVSLSMIVTMTSAQEPIKTDCIVESSESITSLFPDLWARNNTNLVTLEIEEHGLKVEELAFVSDDEAISVLPVPLSLEAGFIFLDVDDNRLIFITKQGSRIEFVNPSDNIHWFKVGHAPEQNQFYIVSWNDDLEAVLVTAQFEADEIQIQDEKPLKFRLNPRSYYGRWMSISPDGKYLFYRDNFDSESELFIYELETDRIIWRAQYGDLRPVINWVIASQAESIAIVSGTESETYSQLSLISQSGEESLWLDLQSFFPYPIVRGLVMPVTRDDLFLFWVRSRSDEAPFDESRLFKASISEQTITNLCIDDEMAALNLSENEELLFYTRSNMFPFTLRLISLSRGVYQDLSTENYAFPFEYRTMPEGSQTDDE